MTVQFTAGPLDSGLGVLLSLPAASVISEAFAFLHPRGSLCHTPLRQQAAGQQLQAGEIGEMFLDLKSKVYADSAAYILWAARTTFHLLPAHDLGVKQQLNFFRPVGNFGICLWFADWQLKTSTALQS